MINLEGFGPQLLAGAVMTLQLALGALVLGLILGIAGAMTKLSHYRALRGIGETYSTVFRGLPELLIILIIYFGTSGILTRIAGAFGHDEFVELSPYVAGVIALGLTFGAYATEVFRGAIQAIPPGQAEAARAFGMSRLQTFLRITMPQVWRVALPGLGNLFLVLLKDTSLVSVIGLNELMRNASIATGATREPFTFYLAAAVLYLLMTAVTTWILHLAEKRASRGIAKAKAA